MTLTKAEREEVWQIISHLTGMGYNITQTKSESGMLTVTLSIPLLSSRM
jgi:predicted acetyltransferase